MSWALGMRRGSLEPVGLDRGEFVVSALSIAAANERMGQTAKRWVRKRRKHNGCDGGNGANGEAKFQGNDGVTFVRRRETVEAISDYNHILGREEQAL